VTVTLATGWLGDEVSATRLLEVARSLDQRAFHAARPPAGAVRLRTELKAQGVRILGVSTAAPEGLSDPHVERALQALERAVLAASALRAETVVFEGGSPEPGGREEATERLARAVHGALRRGVPLAVRNGRGREDLLGFEETEWLLSELPGLGLHFDPARAERAARRDEGPALTAWMDAYAGRCSGVFVHGLGRSGEGGAHPADDGPPWRTLVSSLPRRVPWILEPAETLSPAEVKDALHYLRSLWM